MKQEAGQEASLLLPVRLQLHHEGRGQEPAKVHTNYVVSHTYNFSWNSNTPGTTTESQKHVMCVLSSIKLTAEIFWYIFQISDIAKEASQWFSSHVLQATKPTCCCKIPGSTVGKPWRSSSTRSFAVKFSCYHLMIHLLSARWRIFHWVAWWVF